MFSNDYYGLYPSSWQDAEYYGYLPGYSSSIFDQLYEYFPDQAQGLMGGINYAPVAGQYNFDSVPLLPLFDVSPRQPRPSSSSAIPVIPPDSTPEKVDALAQPSVRILHPSGPMMKHEIKPLSQGPVIKGKAETLTPTGIINPNPQLRTFTIPDFYYSNTARRYNIDNTIPTELETNAIEMINLLHELQAAWGSEIKINSGYRTKALNDKLSSSSDTSVHMIGSAMDIVPANGQFTKFAAFVKDFMKDRNFDQILIEKNSKGSRWIHIGLRNNAGQQRRQIKNMTVV